MRRIRRSLATGSALALVALLTWSHLRGEPEQPGSRSESIKPPARATALSERELALRSRSQSRFLHQPVVTYGLPGEELLFAFQLRPRIENPPAPRPLDCMILVSTAASMGKGELALAQQLTDVFVKAAGPSDRIALATVNTEYQELTDGLQPADKAWDALQTLNQQVPYGAADLKKALDGAIRRLEKRTSRQNVLLFLGDGKSILNPLSAEDRAGLCRAMTAREIGFFPVPLGLNMDPANLHGLASGTGGAPVRLAPTGSIEETIRELKNTLAAPILYSGHLDLPAEVQELFPAQPLLPLRTDAPTLLLGRMQPASELTFGVKGIVGGQAFAVSQTEKVPAPEKDNFFLSSLARQWRANPDRQALVRADRVLAHAYEQSLLARADLLGRAELAIDEQKYEVAIGLFDQMQALDPGNLRAKAGRELIEQLKNGKLQRDDLRKQLAPRAGDRVARLDGERPDGKVLYVAAVNPVQELKPEKQEDLLQRTRQRQALEDQRTTQLVDEAIRQAQRQMESDPEGARDDLKRTLELLLGNPDLSDMVRTTLRQRAETARRDLDLRAGRIQQDLSARVRAYEAARERQQRQRAQERDEERLTARIRTFHDFMDQGRAELASLQMENICNDLVSDGKPVPQAVNAGHAVGLRMHQLRELGELKRVQAERFLLTQMQVDRSLVPFPDEPPVQFPPVAAWKALRDLRKERYEAGGLGPGADIPPATYRLREALAQTVDYEGLDDNKATLLDALDQLRTRYHLTFDVNEGAFRAEGVEEVLSSPIALRPIPKMYSVSLATVLDKILSRVKSVSGATYLFRGSAIEITTSRFQLAEKTVRVYPVLDLVTPNPMSVNSQLLFQGAPLFGQPGWPGGSPFGMGGNLWGPGGNFGGNPGGNPWGMGNNLGWGGNPLGVGGNFGMGGNPFGMGGNPWGAGGNFGFGGNPLGLGGNLPGMGGGFGMGGPWGMSGNFGSPLGVPYQSPSYQLILLIRSVVGTPHEWAPLGGNSATPAVSGPGGQPEDDPNASPEGNSLGYYPPVGALVVRGTSRMHTRATPILNTGNVPPNAVALEQRLGHRILGPEDGDGKDPGGNNPMAVRPKDNLDPRTLWQDALAKGVDDPGLIIAVADYLALKGRFEHAAEFLKAELKQGIVVRPWVFQALAVALRESGGSPDEIERAEVSAVDLQPLDAAGLLKAAEIMKDLKRPERAVAFCKQAALLQPELPQAYAECLVCAEQARDVPALAWAAGNLTGRDWLSDNDDLHARARAVAEAMEHALQRESRAAEAEPLRVVLRPQRQRDLVIMLRWQGQADLDLKITEPSSSVCSWLRRQTPGGGTLLGDTLEETNSEVYSAAEAYPGVYRIEVERAWGRPTGDRAQLIIVERQGTAEETIRTESIDVRERNPLTLTLAGGRRTAPAAVPPPGFAPRRHSSSVGIDQVLERLRSMTEPGTHGPLAETTGGAAVPGMAAAPADGAFGTPPGTLPFGDLAGLNPQPTVVSPLLP